MKPIPFAALVVALAALVAVACFPLTFPTPDVLAQIQATVDAVK